MSNSSHSSFCDRVQDSTPEETHAVPMEVPDTHQDMQSDRAETPPHNNGERFPPISHGYDHLESSAETLSGVLESPTDLNLLDATFEDAMKTMEARHQTALPKNLQGGVLLDQTYATEPKDLNSLLYEPNSQFRRELAQQQGTTNYEESSWRWKLKPNDDTCFSRCVTYTKAATKLVKAVDVIEEQVYLLADGKNFAILNRVSTPDVPYGYCFQVVLQYKITPGPQSSLGKKSSHLVVSWDINFHRNTVMKSVIEGTARQGFKESYESFSETLSQFIEPLISSSDSPSDKDQLLESLQLNYQSDWKLFLKYFCNFTVFSTVLLGSYMLCHILLSDLEFEGLDLPDTFCEMITGGVLALQLERVLKMISHFIRARLKRGNDHGLEGQQGDGWQLTIALIEGCRLPSASPGYPDPYVVFSCNGRSKISSVQLQTENPKWNEILEFGAMQEPPSVLDVKVFSFDDGPFDQEIPIGHAEIKFLKHSSAELADCWVPLEGKLALSSQSKLHLRIFVENTGGDEIIREYLQKMEKEVGKKMNPPSSHKNSTFQKLFGLPSEEFLIHEFSCCLKRKLPVQGKNFLSARIFGFYSNLFGYKTKFFFLWEDIECVQVIPPTLMAVGTPALLIILRNGRGLDARHGAKSIDDEGRLKFQFQSYKSFDRASRTIMALWRSKTCDEQQQKSENDQLDRFVLYSDNEDFDLLKAYSLELPLQANVFIKVFDGGYLENKIMAKVGWINYTATEWESKKVNVWERKVNYKLNTHMSILDGEVASIQRKARTADGDGWIVDEVMTIHNIPFGDHFHIHLSYRFENLEAASVRSKCDVFIGIEWMKNTKFQRRITKYVCDKVTKWSREILELVEKEII